MRATLGEVKPHDLPRPPPRPLVVTTAAAAQTLADPLRQRLLAPFLGRDCTVARAAAELGVPPNSLLYRVKRAEAAGLLRVVRETPRAGRTVKVYRSVADAFYAPFALTRAATLEALLVAMEAPYKAAFYRSIARALTQAETEVGFIVWRSAENEVRTRFAAGPDRLFGPLEDDAPSVLPFWSPEVWLEPDDAKALLGEMVSLIERYHYRGGRKRYLLQLGLAPLEE